MVAHCDRLERFTGEGFGNRGGFGRGGDLRSRAYYSISGYNDTQSLSFFFVYITS